ncbi:DUF7679 family protein [Streptococcus dentasini]
MAKRKKIFYVQVELLNGKRWHYQLPNDLQKPMRMYFHEHPNNWKPLLTGALINVPSGYYTPANHYQPLIRLARVRKFYYRYNEQYWRSRGQFLIRENWQTAGFKQLRDGARFLRHDFKWRSKLMITWDYCRWRFRYRKELRKD